MYVLLLLYYLFEIYVCTGHFNKQLLTYFNINIVIFLA